MRRTCDPPAARFAIDLYWLPLGAGGRSVRLNGRVFEWLAARRSGRPALDLYHAALEVHVPEGPVVIEMTPVPDRDGRLRGVVGEGPVGSRRTRRLRFLRYELRRWQGGVIPDAAEAVASPVRLSENEAQARCLLDLVPLVPTAVWGRDELGTGEMWTSNSVTSWLLARSGVDVDQITPPTGGRAPGWSAGVVAARCARAGAPWTASDPAVATRTIAATVPASSKCSSAGVARPTARLARCSLERRRFARCRRSG